MRCQSNLTTSTSQTAPSSSLLHHCQTMPACSPSPACKWVISYLTHAHTHRRWFRDSLSTDGSFFINRLGERVSALDREPRTGFSQFIIRRDKPTLALSFTERGISFEYWQIFFMSAIVIIECRVLSGKLFLGDCAWQTSYFKSHSTLRFTNTVIYSCNDKMTTALLFVIRE